MEIALLQAVRIVMMGMKMILMAVHLYARRNLFGIVMEREQVVVLLSVETGRSLDQKHVMMEDWYLTMVVDLLVRLRLASVTLMSIEIHCLNVQNVQIMILIVLHVMSRIA